MDKLFQEMEELEKNHSSIVVSANPGDNVFNWIAEIRGPRNSPYENGVFTIMIECAEDYPNTKPTITFCTKIYHPNISEDGRVCVDVLNHWTPNLKIHDALLVICSLLAKPNPASPLRNDVAQIYKTNYTQYRNTAIEWTRKYAK